MPTLDDGEAKCNERGIGRVGTFAPPTTVDVSTGKVNYPPVDPIHKACTEYMTSKLQAGEWAMHFSTVPERRDSLPLSFPRWKTYDPWRSEENLAGIPHFKGQSGKKWRVADPHWPPQKTERQVDVHKEEAPVDIFLQLASVSKDGGGVKVCDLLHSGNVRVHDALWGPGIHARLGSKLHMGFPFLRWQNHVHAPTARNLQDHHQHTGTVNDICFAADDSVVASCGRDCTIRLWEPLTMTPLACLKGHSASVNAVSFSCDGAYVASGSGSSWEHDNTVRIWNVLERNQQEELVGHEAAVSSVHFAAHPRPHLLASASHDHSIRLWDTRNHLDQSHLLATLQQGGMVHCVRWSPCASMLAAASSGGEGPLSVSHSTRVDKGSRRGQVLLWDTETHKSIVSLGGKLCDSLAATLGFAGDPGARVINGAGHMSVKYREEVEAGGRVAAVAAGGRVAAVAAGGRVAAVAAGHPPPPHAPPPSGAADAAHGGAASRGSGVDLCGRYTRAHAACLHYAEAGGQYADNGREYVVNGAVYSQNKGNGWELSGIATDGGAVYTVCWGADSKTLATGARDGVVRLWDVRSPVRPIFAINAHSDQVRGLTFSPCGFLLASCSKDSYIKLWDARRGEALAPPALHLHATNPVWACAFANNWAGPYREYAAKPVPPQSSPPPPSPPPPKKKSFQLA